MIRRLKPVLAFVLALVTLFSTNSFSLSAQGNDAVSETETPAPYVYIDGEHVSFDDEQILNVMSVTPLMAMAAAASQPNVSNITSISVSFSESPNVTMDGTMVSARRYVVTADGIDYEAYCADPKLPGPESSGALYQLSGQANPQLKNALKNGFPVNSQWSNASVNNDDRMWYTYITRVAVAMANNPSSIFGGDTLVRNQATLLANGGTIANTAAFPAIMVNGGKDAEDTGRTFNDTDAKSQTFTITHNRKTHLHHNPFTFEWVTGTPAGAKLVVNGSVIATAPTNPTTVFGNDITSFTIEMPNTEEYANKTAAVNLVGIHNHLADTIWVMQNAVNPNSWQDIVFYIPEVSASAAFSFVKEPEQPPPSPKIKKISNTGAPLYGAKFTITGNGRNETVTVNGELSLDLEDWEDGTYTVTEIAAPSGYELNAAPQTFTLSGNSVSPTELIFVNSPTTTTTIPTLPNRDPRTAEPPSIRIQKIDALTRENIPDALIRIRGGSSFQMTTGDGQLWEIDNTGIDISVVLTEGHTLPVVAEPTEDGRPPVEFELIDGVLTIHNIPWGYYHVEEERAPQGYSLLPQHTAYSFWVLPPNVTVTAGLPAGGGDDDGDEEDEPIDGLLFAAFSEDEEPIDGDEEEESESGGGLEYLIDEDENVTSILITFENYPFGSIELTKLDEITGAPVAGAIFRIEGYFPEGNENGIPTYRMETTDGSGKILWEDLPAGMYMITEVNAPAGYHTSNESVGVPLTWGQAATVIVTNKPYGSLEINKVDAVTGAPISGAVFEVEYLYDDMIMKTTVTTSGGKATVDGLPKTNVSIREILTPAGYVPSDETHIYPIEWGQTTTVTITNTPKSSLEVLKIDGDTGATLAGAVFTLRDPATGETWQATTGGNGIAVLGKGANGNELIPGKTYILTEIQAPSGYVLIESPREVVLSPGDNNLETVKNYTNPTLTIVKRDIETGQPLAGAVFTVEYENGQSVSGSPFTTDASGQIILPWTLFEGNSERTLIITEIIAPAGYILSDPNWQKVTMRLGENNTVTFSNYKKPTLTVIKYDELTNEPLAGATFRIWKTEGETWEEAQITDENGRIVWTDLDPGIYSVQEIDEPYGYFIDPSRKEILLNGGDNKQLTFFNRPRPILTIFKRDQVTGEPLAGTVFRVQALEGLTVGEFITDENGMIEISPRTGYLLNEAIYRVTEITPPVNYLLDANPVKDVMLKWYEPTELVFENLLRPTLIFIKRDGMSGRGISGATYRVQYESANGGTSTLGSYVTKCGFIVLPYVEPGWYVLTETSPASGYQLPTNPTQRFYLSPGENSYTHSQTNVDLYVDQRTNPLSGTRGMCGDCCGFMCSVLCVGNCGNPGDGTTSPGNNNNSGFGNLVITNGNGDSLGNGTTTPTNPGTDPSNPTLPVLAFVSVTRNSDLTATVTFTSSAAGRYYYSVQNSGAAEPYIGTSSLGTVCAAGSNTITVYMTAGAKDLYIKVKDADGNISGALKISIPAYSASSQSAASEPEPDSIPDTPPDFSGITITGGEIIYINPDFSGIKITFGN